MSDIERFITIWGGGGMMPATNGNYVRYDDHRAEVERVTRQNSENFAENERLKNAIDHLTDHLMSERDEAQDEVKRLKEQVAALTVAVEQADEAKADAEAAAAAEEAETDRVTCERDVAQAEVERLKRMLPPTTHTGLRNGPGEGSWSVFAGTVVEERDAAQAEVERLTAERDEARAERDAAQRERGRVQDLLTLAGRELSTLREALRVRRRDQSAQNLDMANGQTTLDTSRPDDETIWREAFMRQLHDDHVPNWATTADLALAEYRKRWPR